MASVNTMHCDIIETCGYIYLYEGALTRSAMLTCVSQDSVVGL